MQLAANANANANGQVPADDVPMHGTQAEVPAGPGDAVGENAEALSGELLPVRRSFAAQTMINGQTSRELIIAVGERLAQINNTMRAASAMRSAVNVNFHDGPVMEGPHGPPTWNKQWLNVVLSFAKDRKYDGLSLVPQTHDQETRYQTYKYNVGSAIRLSQGPKNDLDSVKLVEDQCAIFLCEGSALQCVIDFTEKTNRESSKAELFALLEHQLLGSIS
jgi:hypothetical protein